MSPDPWSLTLHRDPGFLSAYGDGGGHNTLLETVDCTQVIIRGDISCLMAQAKGLIRRGTPGNFFGKTLRSWAASTH